MAGGSGARAAVPFDITLSGPTTFYPGQPLSGPFTGALTAAGIGVPNQTIEIFVDNQPVGTSATTISGSYAFSLPPFTGTSDRTVRVTAFGGTPLDTSRAITVAVERFALDVTVAGSGAGSVSSSPAGIACPGTCSNDFAATTSVTLSAAAASGSMFAGWSGACSGTGACIVSMTSPKSVTATFAPTTGTLNVMRTGAGSGTVSSSPAGISCGVTCSAQFALGSIVQLTAAPLAGSTFAGWSGAGCSGTGSCVITMTSVVNVTATFSPQQFQLFVTKAGSGSGVVTSSPAGINCGVDCTEIYNAGTMVTLTAAPASGSTFAGWSGGGCFGAGVCTVTMSAAQTVTATFTLAMYTLTVSVSGDGMVTSNPSGLTCGANATCSATFPANTVVQLNTLAQAGWVFAGWSGACSGPGCTLVMNSNYSVTAQFRPA